MPYGVRDRAGDLIREVEKATLVFSRRLSYPPELVWKAMTEPSELSGWYMTKAQIDGRKGGTIDFISGASRMHVTGRILSWDPPWIFEHEWKVHRMPKLPSGEDAVIRWELIPDGEETMLKLEHRKMNHQTAVGFAPGTHSFLDRLEAHLGNRPLPNWVVRYREVASLYPSS